MIPYQQMTEPQRKLANHMSEISEDVLCASWAAGLEYMLWAELIGDDCEGWLTEKGVRELLSLAAEACGWVVWVDRGNHPDECMCFLSWSEWASHRTLHRGCSRDEGQIVKVSVYLVFSGREYEGHYETTAWAVMSSEAKAREQVAKLEKSSVYDQVWVEEWELDEEVR